MMLKCIILVVNVMANNNDNSIKVGECIYKYPDDVLNASELEAKLDELQDSFTESEHQTSDGKMTGKGYDTFGIKPQALINRVNQVIGVTHYREVHDKIDITEKKTGGGKPQDKATYKVTVQIGNYCTVFCPDGQIKSCFEILAERTGYGTQASFDLGDAIKGAVTAARKKAWTGFSVGGDYEVEDSNRNPGGGSQFRSNKNTNKSSRSTSPKDNSTAQMIRSLIKITSSEPKQNMIGNKVVLEFDAAFKSHNGEVFKVKTQPMNRDQFKEFVQVAKNNKELFFNGSKKDDLVIALSIEPPVAATG